MLFTIILFILILGLLVVVHEWGHYYAAKKFGIKVYEFGFGFPPRAFGWYRDPETGKIVWVRGKGKSNLKKTVAGDDQRSEFPGMLWSVNWLPIGGFVRIKGENGENAHDKDSFGYHKPWKRIVVLAAGVVMNFVLAAVVLSIGFMGGLPTDISQGIDKHAQIVGEPSVVVQQVIKDSPAFVAGIEFGDKIIRIDDQDIRRTEDMITYVSTRGGETVNIMVERSGDSLYVSAVPAVAEGEEVARLGVAITEAGMVKYPWYIALYKGVIAASLGVVTIVIAFYYLLANLVTGQGLAFELAGPVGIAQIVGQSARLGFQYVLNVTAMLSLSLAVINILPIPALDGGRILFVVLEKIFRRPVSMRYEQVAHTIGFVLLMLLIVVITWRDIVRIF